jgi:uncharacterized membrane protein
MAAVTITRQRTSVWGDRRIKMLTINIANTGDTLVVSNYVRNLDNVLCDAAGTVVVNSSFTAGGPGPVTFNYSGGGAQNAVDVVVIGR